MYYVYLLRSKKYNKIYIGSTNDLRRRFNEHNKGMETSTKKYKPWQLAYYEAYQSEKDARDREKKLKHHGNAIKELKKRIGGSFENRGEDLPSTTFSKRNGAGFTLIELLVVVTITILMSGMMLVDFRSGQKKSLVSSAAHQLAQDIRAVQEKAMSSAELSGGSEEFFVGGYGVYFEKDTTFYRIFVDKNDNKLYDDGELIEEKDLGKIEIIPKKYNTLSEEWSSINKFNIVFIPPDPDIVASKDSDNDEYMITLTHSEGGSKNVMINLAGLIYIND